MKLITITQQLQRQVEIEVTDDELKRLDTLDDHVENELLERAKPALASANVEHVMYVATTQGGEALFDSE